jgi:hypothetical protein
MPAPLGGGVGYDRTFAGRWSGWLSRDPALKDRPGIMSQGWYGAKVGVPRILRVLETEKLPATFFIPGWVVEKYPVESTMIRDAGYEIGHHGGCSTTPRTSCSTRSSSIAR